MSQRGDVRTARSRCGPSAGVYSARREPSCLVSSQISCHDSSRQESVFSGVAGRIQPACEGGVGAERGPVERTEMEVRRFGTVRNVRLFVTVIVSNQYSVRKTGYRVNRSSARATNINH